MRWTRGSRSKPWVKTSLAPGSQVVGAYLEKAGLQPYLDQLGFNLVGLGCTTCIGNSGPLHGEISKAINENGLIAAAVLSGNRNFEGRVSPDVQANYLASPHARCRLCARRHRQHRPDQRAAREGQRRQGRVPEGHLAYEHGDRRIHRAERDAARCSARSTPTCSKATTGGRRSSTSAGLTYGWNSGSTYVQNPPYFEGITKTPGAGAGYRRRAHPGAARRQDHDRPYLARGQHRAGKPGRQLSAWSARFAPPTSISTAPGAATTKS